MTEPALTSQRSRVVIPADLDLTFQIAAEQRHGQVRTAVAGARTLLGSKAPRLKVADQGAFFSRSFPAGRALLGGVVVSQLSLRSGRRRRTGSGLVTRGLGLGLALVGDLALIALGIVRSFRYTPGPLSSR